MAGTVPLNLCLLLPIAILPHVALHSVDKLKTIQTGRELLNQLSASALPYPMAAWRIDNVLLVVLGFAAIPVAMGRWAISRLDSVLLVFGFLAYLIATAIAVLWGHLP